MKIDIDGLQVYFPYDYVYPEQYLYMCQLKKTLDSGVFIYLLDASYGHALLEMPSGTGKTISLLSVIIAYMKQPDSPCKKLIYCSRTIPEIEKAVDELKNLISYWEVQTGEPQNFLGLALSARKNLCIHPEVKKHRMGSLDEQCLARTASFVRAQRKFDPEAPHCDYYEEFYDKGTEELLPAGVYNLEDLRDYGEKKGWCPYFLARHTINQADVIIYSYHYLLDPKIASMVSKDLSKDALVVFDEAHNIDGVCIESMSISVSNKTINRAEDAMERLRETVQRIRETDAQKLEEEYQALLDGLQRAHEIRLSDQVLANPVLPDEILNDPVPGTIRSAQNFLIFLKRFVQYMKHRLRMRQMTHESPSAFLLDIQTRVALDRKPLRYTAERLMALLRALEVLEMGQYASLVKLANFATLVSTYHSGFIVLLERSDDDSKSESSILHLSCLDASIAIRPVLQRFRSVVITSGTLSPITMYPKMLRFEPEVMAQFELTLTRPSICPLVCSKGNDQLPLTSAFQSRNDPSVSRNYGTLLLELSKIVPDGLVCFFPSYQYLATLVQEWDQSGVMSSVQKYKLLFIESDDSRETSVLLDNYELACKLGRGAVLLAVARGRVSEGIDFSYHLGRAVVMFGVPYMYTESVLLRHRLAFLHDHFGIGEQDFLTFDAMRQAAQCVGRALRSKTDYGAMIFADRRYSRNDKLQKLPLWIQHQMPTQQLNLSIEESLQVIAKWLRNIAQEYDPKQQLGISLLSEELLEQPEVIRRIQRHVNLIEL